MMIPVIAAAWLAATKVTAGPSDVPDAGHLASLRVVFRCEIALDEVEEGWPAQRCGSRTLAFPPL